jgi:hypothetical protein
VLVKRFKQLEVTTKSNIHFIALSPAFNRLTTRPRAQKRGIFTEAMKPQ